MWPEIDRRDEPRVEIAVPVEVDGEERVEGRSRDISTEGMRIELDGSLPVASEVSVAFELPDTADRFSATAEVRWRKQIGPKSAGRWIMGVSFIAIHGDDRERLGKFLQTKKAENQ